ncbi:unnamed protein product, partial [Mesorhabditis belari]|uniref:Uncharacterized protein n=1 Tax=Mesorhabditis belari TaxID=2138241 RepID=A0AAF3FPU5_9BILA
MLASRFDSQFGDLFKFLTEMTGDSISGINADGLNDIQREIIHGLPQPNWVSGRVGNVSILPTIMDIKRQMRLEEFNSDEKGKFRGGYLLNNWLSYLEALRDGKKTFSAVLYSSHDGTLNALQSAMGMQNGELVPYAAAILLEVSRSSINDDLKVQVFYRNTTQQPPYLMEIPALRETIKPLQQLLTCRFSPSSHFS